MLGLHAVERTSICQFSQELKALILLLYIQVELALSELHENLFKFLIRGAQQENFMIKQ